MGAGRRGDARGRRDRWRSWGCSRGRTGHRTGPPVSGLFEGGSVLGAAILGTQQVRAALQGATLGLEVAPPGDLGVVAGAQDGRHLPTPVLGWAGVLGLFEEAAGERFVGVRGVVAEHAGDQSGDGLDDDERSGLAAGEDVVADGELAVAEMVGDALVDAFGAATEQGEAGPGRELGGDGVIEAATAGAEEEQWAGWVDRLERLKERFGSHHHAGAAPEGGVVDAAVRIVGVRQGVVESEVNDTGASGPAEQRRVCLL